MKIQEIHIEHFGALRDRTFRFGTGLHVLSGENESGKSTVLSFIRYLLYGLTARNDSGTTSDFDRFGKDGAIGGSMTYLSDDGKAFRLERRTPENGRDRAQLVDLTTGIVTEETEPGKRLFGVSEQVFSGTAFISQPGGVAVSGLSGAIENILTAADATVSVKKAAERINQARRALSPKKGDGGEIALRREELAALEKELQDARENVRAVCDTDAALRDARQKRQTLEEKKNALAEKCAACDTLLQGRRFSILEDTEKKLSGYENALAVLNAPPYDHLTDTAAALAERYRAEPTEETPSAVQTPGVVSETAAEAYEEGEFWESKGRLYLALGISMVIAGLLGLAATLVLIWFAFPPQQFAVPLIATALFLVLGVVFYVLQSRSIRQLNAILDDWAMETLDDLGALADTEERFPQAAQPQIVPRGENGSTDDADNAEEEIRALAMQCGITPDDTDTETLLAALADKGKKADADRALVLGKIENFRGRIAVLWEQVQGADAEEIAAQCRALLQTAVGKEALTMDGDALKRLQKEREFTESAWTAQYRRETELEKAFAAANNASLLPPDVLTGRIYALRREIRELETRAAGYEMAYDALREAGESLRADVTPQITQLASQYMATATDGKYLRLYTDPSFAVSCQTERGTIPVDALSGGTAAVAYVSLRLALADVLFADYESAPLFADEAFAALDPSRLEAVFRLLAKSGRQTIVCTCRPEESRIAAMLGGSVMTL